MKNKFLAECRKREEALCIYKLGSVSVEIIMQLPFSICSLALVWLMLHLKTLYHTRGEHIIPFALTEVPDSAQYVFCCQVQSLEQSFPCEP